MSHGFSSSDHHRRHHRHHRHHHHMDKENLFLSPHENNNEDSTGLTHRFSRSVSLQQQPFNFKVSPELTTGWSGHSPALSQTPSDEDAWNLIYAAAGQVARMKMIMSISDGDTRFVANESERGVVGAPWRRIDGDELFRQQHFCRNKCIAAAWGPPQVQHQRYQQNQLNQHKRVVGGSGGGCDGGATAVKRECAGTGVFLPRRYCTNPPEMRKRQACPPPNLPARMIQSSTPHQTQSTHYEMLMSRTKAMISGAQQQRRRSNIHGSVIDNPEVLLPQEWTY